MRNRVDLPAQSLPRKPIRHMAKCAATAAPTQRAINSLVNMWMIRRWQVCNIVVIRKKREVTEHSVTSRYN